MKLHPLAKINFFPRILAAYSYLFFAWLVLKNELFQLPAVVILIGGLLWPFIAIWLAALVPTKRQELLNMHLDCVLTGCICLLVPNQWVIFSVAIVLIANSIFVGSFRLLLSIAALFLVVVFGGFSLFVDSLISINQTTQFTIMFYLTIYFSIFAFMGYNLVSRFLMMHRKVKKLSIEDPLTGCFNRLYLDRQLPKEILRCSRIDYPIAVIFADIDHFKLVNDTYGHSSGDAVLKSFVNIVNDNIRADTDWVARFGGEEFVIVLTNSSEKGGLHVAERIRSAVEQYTFELNTTQLKLTCSFGVSAIDSSDSIADAEILLSNADQALYSAKSNGRNNVKVRSAKFKEELEALSEI
ncbi:MAG: GGDEF domain-containing protein [Gammaproteobacteria bacterium]|nr:GGDEF domain-containing protein [Gammaproteobacteria bacterium]